MPRVSDLYFNDGTFTAINKNGDGVGVLYFIGSPRAYDGFYFRNGSLISGLWSGAQLPANSRFLADINESGIAAGTDARYAFRWSEAQGTTPLLGGAVGRAINASTEVAGFYEHCKGNDAATCTFTGALFDSSGRLTDMGTLPPDSATCTDFSTPRTEYGSSGFYSINSLGHAVGFSSVANSKGCYGPYHAWSPHTSGDIHPGSAFEHSNALGINDKDQIVGASNPWGQCDHALMWDKGSSKFLPDLGSGSIALKINNQGYAVGVMSDPPAYCPWCCWVTRGVVWKPDGTIVDLGQDAVPLAINDSNQVAGAQYYGNRYYPAIWELGSLAVEMALDRAEVQPVLDNRFDADDQTGAIRPRPDIARITVSVNGVSNAHLVLTAQPQDSSGSHESAVHAAPRPTGTFFAPGQVPANGGGSRGRIELQVNGGDTVLQYMSSGVSGLEDISVVATAGASSAQATTTLTIRWPDLRAMPRNGMHYFFTNQIVGNSQSRHGNVNNFTDPNFEGRLLRAFERYFELVADLPPSPLNDDQRIAITDASLPWGGMFDINGDWTRPHQRHRTGQDVDVRWASVLYTQTFREACDEAFVVPMAPVGIRCQQHAAPLHWHIQPPPGEYIP